MAPTRKACTHDALWASSAAPGRRETFVVVPLLHVELARRAGQQRDRVALASSNSVGTQPISPAGIRSALPPSACAITWAPRQMPSTGRPRACASAMTSRSRSSGASPSVPSGLTMPPSTIRPSNDPAGGSGCEQREPRDGAHAERGERRRERGQRRVEIVLDDEDGRIRAHAPILAHRRAGSAESVKVRRCAQACCWPWDCSTSCGARRTSRSPSRSRRCSRSAAAGIRFVLGGALTLAALAVLGRLTGMPTAAEVRGAAIVGVWLLIGGVGLVTITETHAPSNLTAVLASTDVALGRGLPGAGGRAHRPRLDRRRRARHRRRDRAALARASRAPGHPWLLRAIAAALLWSSASFYGRRLTVPADPFVSAVIQMLTAGRRDDDRRRRARRVRRARPHVRVGPLAARAALPRRGRRASRSRPTSGRSAGCRSRRSSRHQYVNPAVAVVLGAVFLDEGLGVSAADRHGARDRCGVRDRAQRELAVAGHRGARPASPEKLSGEARAAPCAGRSSG